MSVALDSERMVDALNDGWEPFAVTESYSENHNGELCGGVTVYLRQMVECTHDWRSEIATEGGFDVCRICGKVK